MLLLLLQITTAFVTIPPYQPQRTSALLVRPLDSDAGSIRPAVRFRRSSLLPTTLRHRRAINTASRIDASVASTTVYGHGDRIIKTSSTVLRMSKEDTQTDQDEVIDDTASFSWEKQWFPAMPTSYLNGLDNNKPVPVSILGRNLVIWKSGDDEWSVFEDICPHRRSPLSTGQVVAGCLTCRYHGWEFDGSGHVAKVPMRSSASNHEDTGIIRATNFPSQSAGGLLWVYLGNRAAGDDHDDTIVPTLPPEAIAMAEDTAGADWMFNRNPISYISMIENTFDPAHSPWTHEQMTGFAGISFSPLDAIPMERYEVTTPPTIQGFSLEHTPYQNSTAQVAGPESQTIRSFVPPCTVAVASPPFFQTKMWFVPASEYETNVLAFFKTPKSSSRWVRGLVRMFPNLQEPIKDTQHTLQYIGDWNYRFLSQDRITMQGQDQRKAGSKSLYDLTPDTSDTGVATMQHWLQTIAGGGPFASLSGAADSFSKDSSFSRELSFWESHGKYCPRCQRTMRRVSRIQKWAMRWSNRLLVASILPAALFAVEAGTKMRLLTTKSTPSVMSLLTVTVIISSMLLRRLVDWCRHKERRMHSVGADLSLPNEPVFGYRKV